MKIIISLIALLLVIPSFAESSNTKKPNILILYGDDLGYGDLTCFNPQSKIPTPNLDKLASQGVRFTDAHSSSGICTPSRYALLTGRHHWRDFHGIVNAFGKSVFKENQLTLPKMLQMNGYQTAAIGKWHLGWDWDAIRKPGSPKNGINFDHFDWSKSIPDGPLAHGFNYYFGDTVINFPPYCWIENDKVLTPPNTMMDTSKFKPIKEGNWEFRAGPMIEGWNPYDNIPETTRRGVKYILSQKDSEKPFLLYFAYPSPHAPIIPNDKFDGKSAAGPYGDFVCETDDSIGQLLKALEDSGQADNTIVIFSADNGPEHYAYQRDEKFNHWSAFPLRGLKRDIYEGGHRVPTIIKWPNVTKAGTVNNALISQIDLMATIAAALNIELPNDAAVDSHNLLPLLKGEVESVRTTHIHNTNPKVYAIRNGDWLLIDHKTGYVSKVGANWEKKHGYREADANPVELYNLKTDISQKENVAAENPEKVAELQKLLEKIQKQGYSAPRLEQK